MTHQYTKLVNELDAVNDVCGSRSIREAARILRAAASVDVAGLMRRIDEHGARRWDTGCAESAFDKLGAKRYDNDAQEVRAALESALRMALAGR